MSDSSLFLRNVFFSALSWTSGLALLVLLILAARILGDETYGQFAFAYSLVALFEVAVDFGIRDYIVREISRARERSAYFLTNALAAKIALSAVAIPGLIILSWQLASESNIRFAIALLTVSMVARSLKLIWRGILIAHGHFKREALLVAADRLALLVGCGFTLLSYDSLLPFVAAFCFMNVVGLAIAYSCTNRELRRLVLPIDFRAVFQLIKNSLPFGLTMAAYLIYLRLDSVMLSLMRTDEEVGWYNAAYRLVEGLIIVPMIIQYVLFPRVSVLHTESIQAVQHLVTRACKWLLAAIAPIVPLGFYLALPVITLIYGEEYSAAADALRILLLGAGFLFLSSLLRDVLNATNRPKVTLLSGLIGVAVNVCLNLFLIPRYGHLGTSISTVTAEVAVFLLIAVFFRQSGYRFSLIRSSIKPIIALIPGVTVILLFPELHVLLGTFIVILVYISTLLVIRFLDEAELRTVFALQSRLLQLLGGK